VEHPTTTALPADGMLVVEANTDSWPSFSPLVDSTGTSVPLEIVTQHLAPAQCLGQIQFARPLVPLTPGESYSCGGVTFTTVDPVGSPPTDVTLTLELVEHAPETGYYRVCAGSDEGVTRSAGVAASFTTPTSVLLFAETRSTPPGAPAEVLNGGFWTILEPAAPRTNKGHHLAVGFPSKATQGCAHAYAYDLRGKLLADDEQCFELAPADGGMNDASAAPPDGSAGTAPGADGGDIDGSSAGVGGGSSAAPNSSSGCQIRRARSADISLAWLALAVLALRAFPKRLAR
jgi:hypothetical protein